MAAQSMDDSTIRDLESQCKQANADFHRSADSAIKHADILERQVSSGKLDSSKYRITPKKPSANTLRPSPRGDAKV